MNAQFSVENTVIDTQRLVIRPWRQTDLQDFYEYASVEGVGEAAGWRHHASPADSQKVLDNFINEGEVFALTDRKSGKVIGSLGVHECSCYLHEYDCYKMREIGYVLGKAYWGKGLMTEAVQAVISYLFANTDIEMLVCGHFTDNPRSRRVIEKCGFRFWVQRPYLDRMGQTHLCRDYILFNPAVKTEPKRINVLFIGNSHTYFNDMAHTFEILCRKHGLNVRAAMISHGGKRLTEHATEPEVRFNVLYGNCDYVVLQDHGHPYYGEQALLDGAGEIKKYIDQVGAKTVLYMTWAQKGHFEDFEQISAGYRSAAQKLGAILAPVGEYWHVAEQKYPQQELYNPDGKHASPLGSYLIATVIYYSIFDPDHMPAELNTEQLAGQVDMLPEYPEQK